MKISDEVKREYIDNFSSTSGLLSQYNEKKNYSYVNNCRKAVTNAEAPSFPIEKKNVQKIVPKKSHFISQLCWWFIGVLEKHFLDYITHKNIFIIIIFMSIESYMRE